MQSKTFDITSYCEKMERLLGGQEGEAKLFWQAMSYAVYAHEAQKRKSGEAYVSHPCEVARILVEELGVRDPETLAAAVLHDTVEDVREVTNEVIGAMFGKNVEAIVDGVTKIDNFKGDRQNFYKLVHRKLFSGAASRIETMLIKLADRLHNLRTLESMPKHKRQKIAEETIDIYAPMAKVIGLYGLKRELYDLALKYKFPRQANKLLSRIRSYESRDDVKEILKKLHQEMEAVWITADIGLRVKGLWAYFDPVNKVLNKEIESPLEILIAVDDIQTCYRILGIVNQTYPPIPRTIRDFIANPKATGYRCIHARANIRGNNYLFKIRTREMLESGRAGIVAEWSVKKKVPGIFEKQIQEMFDILGADDDLSYREMIAASGKKEIYTYTPKGDPIYLPKQSTVLDFAFKVHTEVGSRCLYGVIGRQKVGWEHVLQDGDQVKIVCQEEPVKFDPYIQELCQTPKARSELARMFRFRQAVLSRDVGRAIIKQEMKHYGIPFEVLDKDEVFEFLEHFEVEDFDTFFQLIGEGRLPLKLVISEVKNRLYANRNTLQPPTGTFNRIELATLDPACIKLSRCCNPVPTDKGLLGLLSERGLSVHQQKCDRIKSLKIQREDVVELRWRLKDTKVIKPQTLLFLKATSRNRLLMMLGVAPDEMKILDVISLAQRPSSKPAWEINFQVDNLQSLKNILTHFTKSGLEYDFALEQ
ncbi:MAG: HD domain-containing protein [Proteobacteria bacterium]|nr:HD domain-containing protein [Pseudomonadota bacterium]MBU1716911.1 HD domain-containing protein [Pseudomonadota bacterium]